MKNVLIVQNTILHYRKALYNQLAGHYGVTVLHSGRPSAGVDDRYKEIITPVRRVGPMYFQSGALREVRRRSYDVIIVMLDIRWFNNLLSFWRHNERADFIWWGAWFTGKKVPDSLRLILSKRCCKSILYTQEAKDQFIDRGVDASKLFVANNTFHVENRKRCYNHPQKNLILFVGSLDKRKQVDRLIEVFADIVDQISEDISLVAIGSGCEKDRLGRLVNSLGLNHRVQLTGAITKSAELLKYYQKAIISVSFGQAGLSVLQSLAYGVAFMTKKNAISGGEKTNIVDGVTGLLCEDDPRSLRRHLLRACQDVGYCRMLGENAYEHYSKHCTMGNMVRSFVSAIESGQKK